MIHSNIDWYVRYSVQRGVNMSQKNYICIFISAAVMLLLPCCAINLTKGEAGMAACFLLFFFINPILTVSVGIVSGKNIKNYWFQPLLVSILFILGTKISFKMEYTEVITYSVAYLAIGYISMLMSSLVFKRKKKLSFFN